MAEHTNVVKMIKSYVSNKRFIRRYEDELLVIDTKYFGTKSSSVIGTPDGSQGNAMHVNATIGQGKLDELNNKHGARYKKSIDDVKFVDLLLKRLPDDVEEMIVHCYFYKKAVDLLCSKYNCSRGTIYNRINAALREDCDLLK